MPQEYGSVQGSISHSGVRIAPQEDEPFRPKTRREMQALALPQPYSPGGIMPGLEGFAPTPDFSGAPGGDATGAMPPVQVPGERIKLPVYQEPEPPGGWKTALGIGLTGMAGLGGPGQGRYAADQFFLEPERRAERDYARDLGAYSARQGEWSQYYEDVLAQKGVSLQEQRLEEDKRQFEEEGKRPIPVPYRGSLYNPTTEELLYQDPRAGDADTLWGAQRQQAFAYWLQAHPGRTLESMDAFEKDEAIEGRRRRRGEEVAVPGFGPGDSIINMPRGESYGLERPAVGYDEEGNPIFQRGRRGDRPRAAVVDEINIADVDEWMADQKRLSQGRYLSRKNQLMAPLPGSPGEAAAEAAQQAELDGIEEEGRRRKERLRSGTIAPGPGEDRILYYNVETGRAEYR